MKRVLIALAALVLIAIVIFQFVGKESSDPEQKVAPIQNSDNSGAFNQSFQSMLTAYYGLKDALVAGDTAKATAASRQLALAAAEVKVAELAHDTTGLVRENAKNFTSNIAHSATQVANAGDIEAKRKEFETITDPLWNLTRTVRFDQQQVYYQYCPMAFDDRGAYWLSNEATVLNPYFGDKMLRCGSVEDSLQLSK